MKILHLKDEPEKSIIFNEGATVLVADLPSGLKKSLLNSLRKMPEIKRILPIFNGKKISEIVVDLPQKLATLPKVHGLSKNDRGKIAETLELLLWHFSPHWHYVGSGAHELAKHCVDCEATAKSIASKCDNEACPSHEKYRLLSGEET